MTFCPQCGSEVSDNSLFCPKCGKQLNELQQPTQPVSISRPTGVTILAVLQLISGIILVIVAIAIEAIANLGGSSLFGQFTAVLGGAITAIILVLAAFAFIIAGALFSGKRWARTLVIILSIIDLIFEAVSIAGGNAFGIAEIILDLIILYYMWRPHVIAYFNR